MPLRRNSLVAWIAAFAVLLQALWPLLSHARPNDPSLLVPVCTVDGITHYLDLKSGKTPLEDRSATYGEHCKLCVFGGDKGFEAVSPLVPVFYQFDQKSQKTTSRPIPSFEPASHRPAQPRAPPENS